MNLSTENRVKAQYFNVEQCTFYFNFVENDCKIPFDRRTGGNLQDNILILKNNRNFDKEIELLMKFW